MQVYILYQDTKHCTNSDCIHRCLCVEGVENSQEALQQGHTAPQKWLTWAPAVSVNRIGLSATTTSCSVEGVAGS